MILDIYIYASKITNCNRCCVLISRFVLNISLFLVLLEDSNKTGLLLLDRGLLHA